MPAKHTDGVDATIEYEIRTRNTVVAAACGDLEDRLRIVGT